MATAAVASKSPLRGAISTTPSSSSTPSLTNHTVSTYTKDRKVGEGTYAVVYLGKQTATKRPIAIKEIKTGLFKDGLDMSAIREVKYLQIGRAHV